MRTDVRKTATQIATFQFVRQTPDTTAFSGSNMHWAPISIARDHVSLRTGIGLDY